MGKDLATVEPAAAQVFSAADDVLGFRLSATCFEGSECLMPSTWHLPGCAW